MKSIALGLAFAFTISTPTMSEELADLVPGTMDALWTHMAVTWACREELGGTGQYYAAMTIAEGTLSSLGTPESQAKIWVDQMNDKFTADPRTAASGGISAAKCIEMTNENLHNIGVWKARIEQARGD